MSDIKNNQPTETNKPETDKPETDKPETDKPETDKPEANNQSAKTNNPETNCQAKSNKNDVSSRIKVSVIMPVYNEEAFLEKSLGSYFSQTIACDCELICVDDGSSDNSIAIIERFSKQNPTTHLSILHQKNEGSGSARNAAMKQACGEFLAFLDADDAFPANNTLELLYSGAREHDQLIAGGSLVMFDGEKERSNYAHTPGFEGHQFLSAGVIEYSDYQFDYGYQRFIYSRDLLESNNIEFPNYLRYQDPPFFVKAMIAAKSFYAITQPTYWYRTQNREVTWTDRKIDDMLSGMKDVGVLAAENNLEHLFALNLSRIDNDMLPIFHKLAIEKEDENLIYELLALRDIYIKTPTELDIETLCAHSPGLIGEYVSAIKTMHAHERYIDELIKQAQDAHIYTQAVIKQRDNCEAECERLRKECAQLAQSRDEWQQKHDSIINSTSFRLGRSITAAPRAIHNKMNGNSDGKEES